MQAEINDRPCGEGEKNPANEAVAHDVLLKGALTHRQMRWTARIVRIGNVAIAATTSRMNICALMVMRLLPRG